MSKSKLVFISFILLNLTIPHLFLLLDYCSWTSPLITNASALLNDNIKLLQFILRADLNTRNMRRFSLLIDIMHQLTEEEATVMSM